MIVETNPVNNIHVEAPQITNIIGQPIVQQVIEPGMMKYMNFFVGVFFCFLDQMAWKNSENSRRLETFLAFNDFKFMSSFLAQL